MDALPILDTRGRGMGSLRLSVTDRCNLRCGYCMPGENYTWMPAADLLSFEELARVAGVFAGLGVRKVRLTGGEPLLRKNVETLVGLLKALGTFEEVAMTTNGLGLVDKAPALRAAGLDRLTISLDSLQRERVRSMSGRDSLAKVLAGLDAAAEAGFTGTKLDVVAMNGFNDDELVEFLVFGRLRGLEVRFIEYMDVLGAVDWSPDDVVSARTMLGRIADQVGGAARPYGQRGSAPAARLELPEGARVQLSDQAWERLDGVTSGALSAGGAGIDCTTRTVALGGLVFGIIASTTEPFCADCDRSRVTADGRWYGCLYAREGVDLRAPLRAGASEAELGELLGGLWMARADRGAEERLAEEGRRAAATRDELARDHHLEMHKRGG